MSSSTHYLCSDCGTNFETDAARQRHASIKQYPMNKLDAKPLFSPLHGFLLLSGILVVGFVFLITPNVSSSPGAVVACTSGCAVPGQSTASIGLNPGQRAPDFSVVGVNNQRISLQELLKEEKPIVVEFFAMWCPHCHADFQAVKPVYSQFSDKINFIAISSDLSEPLSHIQSYATKNGFPMQFATGNKEILNKYGVTYTTTKYFISTNGIILNKEVGEVSELAWQKKLLSLTS